jgi:hypothetical protein
MTARVVPLRSREAGEARVAGTIDERLALVAELSLAGWAMTGLPLPSYRRDAMPIRRTSLKARRDRD